MVTRLRALIVLPTRDLVNQVRETFEEVAKGRGLKVCAADHSPRLTWLTKADCYRHRPAFFRTRAGAIDRGPLATVRFDPICCYFKTYAGVLLESKADRARLTS